MEYPDRIESWLSVPDWSSYEVSDIGRVRSIGRMVPGRWGPYWRPGAMMTPSGGPYLHVNFSRDGIRSTMSVHILVLTAFAGPCPPGLVARHGPLGITVNWWPENLCWGTQSDNLRLDRERDGTAVRGEQVYGAKLTEAIVIECRRRRRAGESVMMLAAEFGVDRTTMHEAVTGRTWSHVSLLP